MKISIIAAMDEKRGIGKDNKIPWHIKEDLVRLKNLTIGHTVILGRTTYESMLAYYQKSGKPTMSMRTHIVVTRDPSYHVDENKGLAAHSIEEAVRLAREKEALRQAQGLQEIFVIGGEKIFEQTIGLADKLYLTIVEDPPTGGFGADAFFPDYSEFKKVIFEQKGESEGHKYTFLELER